MGGNKVSSNPALVDAYRTCTCHGASWPRITPRGEAHPRTQDAFALRSHQRASAAIEAGRFKDEIVPCR